jgi:hypothetical protein
MVCGSALSLFAHGVGGAEGRNWGRRGEGKGGAEEGREGETGRRWRRRGWPPATGREEFDYM